MEIALEEAELALEEGEVPVGACVVYEGKIIARAHNTREQDLDISGHAEIVAMRLAANYLGHWTLDNCSLYVTLEPCPMCAGAIKQARIRSLYFGARDEQYGAVVSNYHLFDEPNSPLVYPDLLSEEATALLNTFFKKHRK